jgi:hypothetical protein
MTRTFVAALMLATLSWPVAATIRVDLGDDKALDAIQAKNPAQYKKVMGIIKAAGEVSCETLPQMLKVQYGATDVQCAGAHILTSYPAKRRLAFTLDDVAFSGNIVLTGIQPIITPAKQTESR